MYPDEYFSGHERVVSSAAELFERVQQIDALADQSNLRFYWRGQGDADWGLHSSLHRRQAASVGVSVEQLQETAVVAKEIDIVQEARGWVRPAVGARLPTMDLFARLQHFGAPTRFLDFTIESKVAAYFAVVDEPDRDGRLFAAAARGTPSDEFRNSFDVPWRRGVATRPIDWSSQLYVLDDHADFSRIINQRGVFLTGGTPSTQPQRRTAAGHSLLAAEVRQSMSIPLALHSWTQAEAALVGAMAPGRRPSVASGLTLRIPQPAKEQLRMDLEVEGYSMRLLFPDPEGYKEHSPLMRELLG